MLAHIDADSFFASVLQRKHPHLKGKPLIAMGMGGGCVIAASYEAKAKGVKTGMPMKEAILLCPEAVRMPSDFRETGLASQQIEAILMDICPLIEQYSIDEWFLDLASKQGGSPADPETWAKELQAKVKRYTDISVSIGIGPSKLLAKMASEYRKPAGVTVVAGRAEPINGPGGDVRFARLYGHDNGNATLDIESFLRDRPAEAIPGIGRQRAVHTEAHGWLTAWDFAQAPRDTVQALFGRPGPDLQRELNGERLSGIAREESPPKSVSRTRTFRHTDSKEFLWAHVLHHAQYVTLKMRKHGLSCTGVAVWLRTKDYKMTGNNRRLPRPMHTEETIIPHLKACFQETYDRRHRYNQAGMALWGLVPTGPVQASLFEDVERSKTDEKLQASLDVLRKKYGREVIDRGAALSAKEDVRPGLAFSSIEPTRT